MSKVYSSIVKHYEACLAQFGDTHKGVDWPNRADAEKRYGVMLEGLTFLKDRDSVRLLDFGCGTAHLLDFLISHPINNMVYTGTDISHEFIEVCKRKYPDREFVEVDILENPERLGRYDFIIMNGVFTEKVGLAFDDMFSYFQNMMRAIFAKTEGGVAFNLMSKHVDWEREDLFHLPFDMLAAFLTRELSRNFIIRNDYGLYEYTVYLYK